MRKRLVMETVMVGILWAIAAGVGAARAQVPEPAAGAVKEVCNGLRSASEQVQAVCSTLIPLPRFVDNQDGTVTDNQTGLMWEKKTSSPGVHNVDDSYGLSTCFYCPGLDGTAFTAFLAALNNCTSQNALTVSGGFAGHCDWRVPQIHELRGILTAEYPSCSSSPCIDPVFGPTASTGYWSATSNSIGAIEAWSVNFGNGEVGSLLKAVALRVRAVRGGSE